MTPEEGKAAGKMLRLLAGIVDNNSAPRPAPLDGRWRAAAYRELARLAMVAAQELEAEE